VGNITSKQKLLIHRLLDQQEASVLAVLARDGELRSAESFGELAPGEGSEGDRPFAQKTVTTNLVMAMDLAGELDQIAQARERLDTGHYGTCIDCQEKIDFDRLKARPMERRCAHCQEQHAKQLAKSSISPSAI
jgi:DnaK suppressor protein